jgi:hypothetical protein
VPFTQLPVCGRIELDVDPAKARWFDAWVAQRRRVPHSVAPSVAPSVSHWRGDSKTTFLEDAVDEQHSDILALPPRPRHIPRQLSLLNDRLETGSIASSIHLPTAFRTSRTLEPELEQPEPAAPARDDKLANRVRSWRASSSVAPSPMAATGQISLDPAHMPNNMELRSPEGEGDELRLEDFQWSISSAGPADEEPAETPAEWRSSPSVHLAARAEGSVMLSPSSAATSWGPTYDGEDYLDSPVSWARLSSVDLARRLEGSVVLTPSVATTWGPLSDDGYDDGYAYGYDYGHSSYAYAEHAPSPHLAERCLSDAPLTPTTATSWGPDDHSAFADYADGVSLASWRPPTPGVADRCLDSCPPTPTTATSWGAPSWPPSEAALSRCSTPDLGARAREDGFEASGTALPLVWPHTLHLHAPTGVRALVWPHAQRLHAPTGVSALVYPFFRATDGGSRWAWPYTTVVDTPAPVSVRLAKQYPAVGPCKPAR